MSQQRFSVFVLLCIVTLINGQEKVIPPQPSTLAPPTESTTSNNTTPSTVTNATTASTTPTPPTTIAPPGPQVGHYVVKDHAGNACIIADLAAEVWISLNNHTLILTLPSNMLSDKSNCTNETDYLELTAFNVGNANSSEFYNITLTLIFIKDDATKHYRVANTTFSAEGLVKYDLINNKTEFSTPLSKSYHCAKEQNISMSDRENNQTLAALKLSHVQLEAFHGKNDTTFGAAVDCQSSLSPDIVPIAVGCSLAGLIAVVMIAYLVGRRRSQARGYLSM